jgi:hypothetical protein
MIRMTKINRSRKPYCRQILRCCRKRQFIRRQFQKWQRASLSQKEILLRGWEEWTLLYRLLRRP